MPIRVYYEVLNQKGTPALYSDNYASRPAAGYVGRIFYSPDTAQIFYDTGSTWTLLADAGVGSGSLASVCANGNTTATGISITAGGLSTNSLTSTNLTAGSIPFIGTGGLFSQDNTNFFWDNTNKYFGINTNTPSTYLDVHGTNNVQVQINNTTTADSKIAFLNASVGKWRIGNLYSGGANLFHIYNNTLGANAMTIDGSSNVTFVGSVLSSYFIGTNGVQLVNGSVISTSGRTGLGGLTNGISVALSSGFTQQLLFPTGVAYQYTFPSATGTILLGSGSTAYVPKFTGANNVAASNIYDNGTAVTVIGTGTSFIIGELSGSTGKQLLFSVDAADGHGEIQAVWQGTGNQNLVLNRYGGSVGIGIVPTAALDINVAAGTMMRIKRTGVSGEFQLYQSSNLVYLDAAGASCNLALASAGIERMRLINSAGTACVLIGTTSTVWDATNRGTLEINGVGSSLLGFKTGGTNRGYIYANGTDMSFVNETSGGKLICQNVSAGVYLSQGATSWTSNSDERLKNITGNIENALDSLLTLRTIKHTWKLGNDNKEHLALIAQDVQKVFPELIDESKLFTKADEEQTDNTEYLGVRYTELVPVLVKAIQELNQKIENLN